MIICLERGADSHMAQLMSLPVFCFSKIQIGFTFLVPAHPGCPGKRAVKRVCVCVCVVHGCRWLVAQPDRLTLGFALRLVLFVCDRRTVVAMISAAFFSSFVRPRLMPT